MKFVYLKLKFQKAFKNRDGNDSNLHFDNTFLIVLCNFKTNLKKKKNTQKTQQEGLSGLLWHTRVTGANNQSSSKWSQQV